MGYKAKFRVWRGDAGEGELKDYTVEVNEGEVVLDVIHRLQATEAPDLAVRWNCKAGKCGSCSAEINGMSAADVHDADVDVHRGRDRHGDADAHLPGDPRPGHGRLVQLREGAARCRASTAGDVKPGEFRMQQVDVERSQEFRKCIECFLCNNICHVIRDHEENKRALRRPALPHAGGRAGDAPGRRGRPPGDRPGGVRARPTATSPSAAPRSAPSTSRSLTTP